MTSVNTITPSNTNLVSGAALAGSSYSPYPGGGNGADNTATMNFDDFLDMVNPLQHIPVVSSIYRAVTGENINPVSRILGDTMYGGIMGLASAGLSALGAIGDEVVGANNDGQSLSATVVAALFGPDNPAPSANVQLAAATTPSAPATTEAPTPTAALYVAGLQTPALQSPILDMPDFSNPPALAAVTPDVFVQTASAQASNPPVATDNTTPSTSVGMPLDRSKMPYGGVMDTAMMQSAQQNQTLALAMSSSARTLQNQHDVRNSRFATAAGNASIPQVQIDAQTQAAMQNLIKELQASKAANQYKNTAQSTLVPSSAVNTMN